MALSFHLEFHEKQSEIAPNGGAAPGEFRGDLRKWGSLSSHYSPMHILSTAHLLTISLPSLHRSR